jgi:biopolymer transport protein ExbD
MAKRSTSNEKTKHVGMYLIEKTTYIDLEYVQVLVPQSATEEQIKQLGIKLCKDGSVAFNDDPINIYETRHECRHIDNAGMDMSGSAKWVRNADGEWEAVD